MSNEQLSHTEIEALLGAYALDAVDREEANAVELHLRECPRCESEVAGFRETAALLAHSGTAAPSGVWDGIVAGLEDAPPRPIPFASPARPRPRLLSLVSAAAAVVLLAGGVSWAVGRQNTRSHSGDDPLDGAITAAYADPHARPVRLQSGDGSRYVDVVLLPNGTGFLVRNNLPALPADRTYQLWANVGSATVSLGVLGSAPPKLAFAARTTLVALAITEEQAGGVVVSDHSPLVTGTVSA
ncbi:MAG TPA: anti-sigma factor [Acidimicrobiales bacterium]|nr:anti-sigma factor [Acidimicrobiales bacterium]